MAKRGQFPDLMPDPDRGWSRELLTVGKARVYPPTREGVFQQCGVTTAAGEPVIESMTWRGLKPHTLHVQQPPEIEARIGGRHLYAGQYFQHFGHFVTESTARLWAARRPELDGIIFIGKHVGRQTFGGYQKAFLDLLGVSLPVHIVHAPSEVEELVIPGSGFGLGPIARGTPEFRDFVSEALAGIAPEGEERIYISRTRAGGKGRVLLEERIEANMARSGYAIYHPQEHGLAEQFAQYKAATHIVGLDGSAFHMVGFVARPEQRIAMILRRNSEVYYNLFRQIEGFSGRAPDILNVLVNDWVKPRIGRPNRESWGEVDHSALAERLRLLGYVDGAWEVPTGADMAQAIAAMNRRMRMEMAAKPVVMRVDDALRGTF